MHHKLQVKILYETKSGICLVIFKSDNDRRSTKQNAKCQCQQEREEEVDAGNGRKMQDQRGSKHPENGKMSNNHL